jgi:hypothetical protein
VALACPLVAAEAGAEAPAKPKPITLRSGPLVLDGQAMVPGSVGSSRWQLLDHTPNTVLRPPHVLEFKDQTALTVAGSTFTFSQANQRVSIAAEKGRPMAMKQRGIGFEPVPIPIAGSKRQLTLAFPAVIITSKDSVYLWWANGSANRGSIDGAELYLYDEDCDGAFRPGTDCLSVGSGVVFAPIGDRVAGPKGVYRIGELSEDGTKLALEPDTAPAGRLSVKGTYAGGEAHVALAAGGVEMVVVQGKTLAAPAGQVTFRYGLVMNPARRTPAAMIVAGKLQAGEVVADQAATLALGGPFTVGFTPTVEGGKIKIDSNLVIAGAGSEEYRDFKWSGPPQVLINGKAIGSFGFG